MRPKRRRMAWVLACGVGLSTAAGLSLAALRSDLVFFVTPSDLALHARPGRTLRLGGLVAPGSVRREARGGEPALLFAVTDRHRTQAVRFRGVPPELFAEGQGVVTLGELGPDGVFEAAEVLAKHDATYMPPDVAAALRVRGEWRP